ncbi:MAG: hypothetical protein RMY16_23410 [Nostoc sp. DedQUE12b]|uniref:hypothetical protein n=1 Tax=Nostoc sp. DedQUE12b TaxID=3075398 RepID=UPI002AD2AAD9|nr:hypothetical protein [Nostoc sp. DedQUE12b]MDZ8088483.1 hypothetical protein [Nostoc sp. DedQUE12b]
MCKAIAECIKMYIETQYRGGLIGISDLATNCKVGEGNIYVALVKLQKEGDIKIIKRYFCPESHQILVEDLPFCLECDYLYAEDFITTLIYVQPLKLTSTDLVKT